MSTAEATRILIVDDDPGMLTTLSDIFSAFGYDVDTANSGMEAIERVQVRPPECILMDVRMPGLNGVETFREIKRLSPEAFVIFMTAFSTSGLIEDALREGAVQVIPKPLDIESVLHLIAETTQRTPVLVVDDDPAIRRSLGDALEVKGIDVLQASTIDEAVEVFRKEPQRVVVLDMKLNGRTGLDAMLLFEEVNPRAIVILMTGYVEMVEPMQGGVDSFAASCFTKPFEVETMVAEIEKLVQRRRERIRS